MGSEQAPVVVPELGVLEAITTTRAIRRYRNEPVPPEALREMLFAATRAPSGSNRQPFRFLVLTDGDNAREAKSIIQAAARQVWEAKSSRDGYRAGSGTDPSSPKSRMAKTMQHYIDHFDQVPVLVLACLLRYRAPAQMEGASVYPACQNLLLAARAMGYGGVMTGFHRAVETELRQLLAIPDKAAVMATITLGRPLGSHGPVRRLPMGQLVFGERWSEPPAWVADTAGTRHAGGPGPT